MNRQLNRKLELFLEKKVELHMQKLADAGGKGARDYV
jgi:hypothetical protein